MIPTPTDEPVLSRAEWQAVAIAFKDAAAGGCPVAAHDGRAAKVIRAITGAAMPRPLADPRLEAVRSFVCATRRRGRADALVPRLVGAGFNDRQIAALARLAA